MLFSILIPSLKSRMNQLIDLKLNLYQQIIACNAINDIEIITETDNGEMSIGAKRNKLLERAAGKYLCSIDDDDTPSSTYISKLLDCIKTKCDNCSLMGIITWDGNNPELFEHSIKYKEYRTNDTGTIKYERYPNHLNVIRTDIAKQFKFPNLNHGEDTDFAPQIFNSGLLKNETKIEGVIYHYNFKTK